MTKQTERNLKTFMNRVWREISIDETTRNGWMKYNKELYVMLELAPVTSFIMSQRIQCLSHIMRRGENETVRTALE